MEPSLIPAYSKSPKAPHMDSSGPDTSLDQEVKAKVEVGRSRQIAGAFAPWKLA
jgi:hypothetical protein